MKDSFKVALLLDDKSNMSLLKSIFTLTEKRTPSYVKEDNIQEFGYLGVDICIVDPNSIASIKTYLKILKYHNKVKALFLLGPNLPATTLRDKLTALEYQEKYANLLKIFKKEIDMAPLVAHPFSWIKVVAALDSIAKSVNAENNNQAQDNDAEKDDTIHIDNPYEDPNAFKRNSVDYASMGYPSSLSSVSASTNSPQYTNRSTEAQKSGEQASAGTHRLSARESVQREYSTNATSRTQSSRSNHSYTSGSVLGEISAKDKAQELDIRAIVIDESSASRRWLAEKLQAKADKIDFAIDGQEALIMMNQKTYDVVFLDTDTVSYDGYQVCKVIKAEMTRQGIQCQVVLMTGQKGLFDKFRINMSNCDAVLKKPIADSDLFKIVNKVRKIRLG